MDLCGRCDAEGEGACRGRRGNRSGRVDGELDIAFAGREGRRVIMTGEGGGVSDELDRAARSRRYGQGSGAAVKRDRIRKSNSRAQRSKRRLIERQAADLGEIE